MSGIRRYRRERTYPLHFSNPFYTTGFVDPSRTFESELFFGDGITSLETRDALRDFQHMLERQNAGIRTTYEGEMRKMLLNDKLHKQNAIANWLVQMISESEDMDGIPDDKQKIIINWSQQISNPIIREHVLQKLQEKLDKGRVKHIAQMTASKEPLSSVSEGENVPRISQKAEQEQKRDARTAVYREVKTELDGTPPTQQEIDDANPKLAEPLELKPEAAATITTTPGVSTVVPTPFEQVGYQPTRVPVEQIKQGDVAPPDSAAAASLTYSHPDDPGTEVPDSEVEKPIEENPSIYKTPEQLWVAFHNPRYSRPSEAFINAMSLIRVILDDRESMSRADGSISPEFVDEAKQLLFKAHRYNPQTKRIKFDMDFLRAVFRDRNPGDDLKRPHKRLRGSGMFKSFGLEDDNGIRWWR